MLFESYNISFYVYTLSINEKKNFKNNGANVKGSKRVLIFPPTFLISFIFFPLSQNIAYYKFDDKCKINCNLFLFIQQYKVLMKCKGKESCIGLCVPLKCTRNAHIIWNINVIGNISMLPPKQAQEVGMSLTK